MKYMSFFCANMHPGPGDNTAKMEHKSKHGNAKYQFLKLQVLFKLTFEQKKFTIHARDKNFRSFSKLYRF